MFNYSNITSNIWVYFDDKIIDILQIESIEKSTLYDDDEQFYTDKGERFARLGLKSGRTVDVNLSQQEVLAIIKKNVNKE